MEYMASKRKAVQLHTISGSSVRSTTGAGLFVVGMPTRRAASGEGEARNAREGHFGRNTVLYGAAKFKVPSLLGSLSCSLRKAIHFVAASCFRADDARSCPFAFL